MQSFAAFFIFISCFWQGWPAAVQALLEGPHINTLNILLPPKTTHPVQYRLQGSGGCFTWAWDHHDIIEVTEEYNATEGCSNSAVVTSVAAYDGRRATAIYATDSITGQVIRCEVFIDNVSRVRIFHQSLKLDLDGLATLRIRAFDVEDNEFSSLVGIQFLWRLLPSSSFTGTSSHSLTHLPLKDTPLSDCGCICGDIDTQIELEQKGLGSDLYVVRGINVGQERISVSVFEPQLEKLGDEILLTVAEAISLEPPSPLYILVGTQVQFTLKTLRYKMPSTIQLPSPYHRWSITNSSVAEVDPYMGTVSAHSIGSTHVVVEDIRVTGHQQISSVHVVEPFSLLLYLTPLHFKDAGQRALKRGTSIVSSDVPWYLVVGWDYVVQVMAFSLESRSRPLYLTKDNDLRLFSEEWPYWKAIPIPEDVAHEQGWQNGTLIKAVSEGTGKLVASLKYSKSLMYENLAEVLIVEQEVTVCNLVLILFENELPGTVVNLPWNPNDGQDYQLEAQGGCGNKLSDYRWTSSDVAVATVSSLGVVHVKGLGQALIRVTASTNPMNTDEVVVEVSAPSSIACLGGLPVEAEVGSHLPAAITLKSPEGFYYSKCQSFFPLIIWRIFGQELSFLQVNDTRNSGSLTSPHHFMAPTWAIVPSACAWTYFVAVRPGQATVTATLSFDDFSKSSPAASGKDLVVSWTIAAYAPLTIVQASDGKPYGGYDCGINQLESFMGGPGSSQCQLSVLLLVPGSSMKVMLRGGPEHWGQGVEFIERYDVMSNSEENAAESVHVSHLVSHGGRFYEIACGALGNYTLIFYRGNSIGEDHPIPVVAEVNLSVVCSLPSSITLLVDETGNALPHIKVSAQADRDQNRVHKVPITVVNGRTLRVAAVALNANGNPFANTSSLPLNWVLKDCTGLAYWAGHDTSLSYIGNGPWEEKLVLRDASGQCLIRASVEVLTENNWFLPALRLAIQEVLHPRAHILTDAVQLQLVTSVRVEPKFLLLYHHLDAKAHLAVLGGSGHVETYINDSKVAVILEQPSAPHHVHLTVAARGLGMVNITVRDVGLIIPAADTALVHVAEVAWVRLLLPEESSIEVGTFLIVNLQTGDNAGNIFDSSQFEFMDIRVHVRDEVLELVPNENLHKATINKVLGSTFMIRGANLGVTDLYVSVWPNFGHEILSELRKVEVYAPLSIHPEGLVLAPGARYVVCVHGGPSVGVVIHFSSYNDTIASIENPLGMVVANSPGVVTIYAHAYTHGETIVCKAEVEVKVQIPVSMFLNVQGGQLAIGRGVSIFPTGTQEDLFSFFELCSDYKWTIGDEQVLTLRSANEMKHHGYSNNFQDGNKKHAVSSISSAYGESRLVDARFSVVAVGMAAGKTDIKVAFSCQFHSKGGYYNSQSYTASDTIRVIPDLPLALGILATWLLPPNFKTSSLLPQLSDSVSDNTPTGKRSITYSFLQDSTKESGGIFLEGAHIRTTERNALTCIQARDRRTGRSEVAVCVKVAEVSHMIIGDTISSFHVVAISVGASQLYSLTLQDNIGTPFFEVGNAVKLTTHTNRMDLVSVRILSEEDDDYTMNATILLQALRPGTALIRVSQLGNPNVADYILVHAGVYISPRKPFLHVGGHVNFSILGMGPSSSEQGHWSSSNLGVIQIHQYTGEAIAVGAGSASVSFNTSRMMASTTATIVQLSSVAVTAPEGQLTNVHSPKKGYQFPVRVSDPQGHDLGLFAKEQKVSFKCHVDPPYIGHCSPWHDPGLEKSYCIFQPHPPERLFLSLQRQGQEADSKLKAGDAKGRLIMKIFAEVPGIPEVGTVLTTFAGGFTILDLPAKLHFNPRRNSTRLTVVGSAGELEVSWTKKDALEVKRISSDRDAHGVGGHAIFEVMANNDEQPFVSKLIFFLPTTGQREEVNVEYDLKHQGKGALSHQIITATIITLVLGVFPLIICACLLDLPRPFRGQQEGRASSVDSEPSGERPSMETPVSTPNLGSKSFETPDPVSLSRSPPRPYTDYVSKTIENTPYFRRGVRRFDPSRTY